MASAPQHEMTRDGLLFNAVGCVCGWTSGGHPTTGAQRAAYDQHLATALRASIDKQAIRQHLAHADRLIFGIAKGTERLTMRVPADETRDADLIIGNLARDVEVLLDALEQGERREG